jgi:hypothetical protein
MDRGGSGSTAGVYYGACHCYWAPVPEFFRGLSLQRAARGDAGTCRARQLDSGYRWEKKTRIMNSGNFVGEISS